MGLRLRAGAGAPVGPFVAVSRGSVAIVVMFWFSALSLRSGFRLLRSSVSGSTAGRGAAPPDAGLSIENAQGAQRAHPRPAVGHPRLDRGVAGRGEVELGVAGLQASRHARGEALAGLVELLLRQALPLPGDGHLLLCRAEIEKGLAGFRPPPAGPIPDPALPGDEPRLPPPRPRARGGGVFVVLGVWAPPPPRSRPPPAAGGGGGAPPASPAPPNR